MERIQAYRSWLYLLAIFLLLPALLINLGLLTFIDDEAIRALVALEMKLSGNFITPTLHGEYYYNKPPLFNWILLAFFNLSGQINEFTARFPTVLALLGYGATVYYFLRKHYSFKIAFLNAFFLISCGRILFWDSMLALIDVTFSWVIFSLFMILYHEMEKERYLRLFILTYLLTALAFLLKGLPAVVFQGISLFVYFVYQRKFKKLFSWAHLLGGFAFLSIVGGYYFAYHQYNSLENVFATLFSESSKRTAVNYGLGDVFLHFFTFPFEMLYHFLPWTFMSVFFLRKGSWRQVWQAPFIRFCLLMFSSNILIYWTSPEVYPRYLLMLFPLLFSAFLHLWENRIDDDFWGYRLFFALLGLLCVIISLGSLAPFFVERIQWVPGVYVKSISLFFTATAFTLAYFYWRSERILIFILILLVFRIGFDWFVLPDRNRHDYGDICRESTIEVGDSYADQDLYIYWEDGVQPISSFYLQPTNSFYLTKTRKKIIPLRYKNFQKGDLLIFDPQLFPNATYQKIDEIKARHHNRKIYELGKQSR